MISSYLKFNIHWKSCLNFHTFILRIYLLKLMISSFIECIFTDCRSSGIFLNLKVIVSRFLLERLSLLPPSFRDSALVACHLEQYPEKLMRLLP